MATQPYIKMLTTPFTQYNLPYPAAGDGYEVEREYRGGMRRMANGMVSIDLVDTNAKRKIVLTWSTLTTSEKATVQAAYDLLKSAACEFRSPENETFNVTRDPDNPSIRFAPKLAAGGALRFRATLYLVEV